MAVTCSLGPIVTFDVSTYLNNTRTCLEKTPIKANLGKVLATCPPTPAPTKTPTTHPTQQPTTQPTQVRDVLGLDAATCRTSFPAPFRRMLIESIHTSRSGPTATDCNAHGSAHEAAHIYPDTGAHEAAHIDPDTGTHEAAHGNAHQDAIGVSHG